MPTALEDVAITYFGECTECFSRTLSITTGMLNKFGISELFGKTLVYPTCLPYWDCKDAFSAWESMVLNFLIRNSAALI